MSLKLIAAPTAEPVTLAEAKVHLRVDGADDDAYITALIVAARQGAEHITERALLAQTWELALDGFPAIGRWRIGDRDQTYISTQIMLPRPPLTSITSVKYLNDAGVLTTMDESVYLLDDRNEPARLLPAYGATWPATRDQANAVLIRYVAGYANAAVVPQEIKSWMLLRIGLLYENRESVIEGMRVAALPFVDRLLDASRVWGL